MGRRDDVENSLSAGPTQSPIIGQLRFSPTSPFPRTTLNTPSSYLVTLLFLIQSCGARWIRGLERTDVAFGVVGVIRSPARSTTVCSHNELDPT
jgi:hypothetical protein